MSTSLPKLESAEVDELVKGSGTSFYWAMRLMPGQQRQAMFSIYAFCRVVDDVADGSEPPEQKVDQLSAWRDEIRRIYAGTPVTPVGRALSDSVERFSLEERDLLDIIDGMEMDATPSVRISDLPELFLYCDRVACAVGRLSVGVYGESAPWGLRLARTLGDALQITNILRDIDEDAGRDRVYLPKSMLDRAGIDGESALQISAHPDLFRVAGTLADLAEARDREASFAMQRCDPRRVRSARMMMAVYHHAFRRLRQRGWNRPRRPVRIPRTQKLIIAISNFF